MAKQKIPVYDIAKLAAQPLAPGEFMVEPFADYLDRHSPHLHHAHRHDFYHLVCFTGGRGTHSIDFSQFPVEAGQIYFMTPGQVHSWSFEGRPDGYVINFSGGFLKGFLLDANYLERFSFFNGIAVDSVVRLASPVKEKVFGILEEMVGQFRDHVEADLLRAELVQLFLLVQSGVSADRPVASKGFTPKQPLLPGFRKLLEQHYKTMRLPSEYAALLFITPNHLNALSRDLLGRSAGEVIRDRVLLEAKRLLTNAGMTATEIAYELNFPDNSYFNRFFKKYEGVTPEEFRRKHRVVPA